LEAAMFATVSVHSTTGKGAARWWRALWLVWVVIAWAAQPSLAQQLIWLGTLGGDRSEARGVSADGSVVVGWADNAAGQRRAFRWTAAGGMQDLGTLGSVFGSEATAVSADGSVVVGWAENAAWQKRAFRWTAARGMEDLNLTYAHLLTDGSVLYSANAISPDGRYIAGWGYNAATRRIEAFLLDTRRTWR
jgi:probable HAF family extracellular repeat protein